MFAGNAEKESMFVGEVNGLELGWRLFKFYRDDSLVIIVYEEKFDFSIGEPHKVPIECYSY